MKHALLNNLPSTEKLERRSNIVFRSNLKTVHLKLTEILFIEALSDYVMIKTITGQFITISTMKNMMNSLPCDMFVRTHRSFIVNREKINSIRDKWIMILENGIIITVPIGKAYETEIKKLVNNKQLKKEHTQ